MLRMLARLTTDFATPNPRMQPTGRGRPGLRMGAALLVAIQRKR